MVDYTSVLIGAAAVYAVVLHMITAYLYAARQVGEASVSATETDVEASGEGQ